MRGARLVRTLAFCALSLATCQACSTTRSHTVVTGDFPGIRTYYARDLPVSLLFIHGMGGYSNSQPGSELKDPEPALAHIAAELCLVRSACATRTRLSIE